MAIFDLVNCEYEKFIHEESNFRDVPHNVVVILIRVLTERTFWEYSDEILIEKLHRSVLTNDPDSSGGRAIFIFA